MSKSRPICAPSTIPCPAKASSRGIGSSHDSLSTTIQAQEPGLHAGKTTNSGRYRLSQAHRLRLRRALVDLAPMPLHLHPVSIVHFRAFRAQLCRKPSTSMRSRVPLQLRLWPGVKAVGSAKRPLCEKTLTRTSRSWTDRLFLSRKAKGRPPQRRARRENEY